MSHAAGGSQAAGSVLTTAVGKRSRTAAERRHLREIDRLDFWDGSNSYSAIIFNTTVAKWRVERHIEGTVHCC